MTGFDFLKNPRPLLMPGIALVAAWSVAASAAPTSAVPSHQEASTAASVTTMELGAEVYVSQCQPCHGGGGKGDGPAARFVDPKPRDLTAGEWRYVGDGDLEGVIRVITDGVDDTAMEPFGELLTEAEVEAAALFVLNKFANPPDDDSY